MLNERFLQSNPPDVVGRLEPAHQASLNWLTDYFGKAPSFKDSALKIIRDKTAFHYHRLNLTEAADNLALGENSIYLAQHPSCGKSAGEVSPPAAFCCSGPPRARRRA